MKKVNLNTFIWCCVAILIVAIPLALYMNKKRKELKTLGNPEKEQSSKSTGEWAEYVDFPDGGVIPPKFADYGHLAVGTKFDRAGRRFEITGIVIGGVQCITTPCEGMVLNKGIKYLGEVVSLK